MWKKNWLLISVLFVSFCFGQEKVDLSVSYKLTYQTDSTSQKQNTENFILFANKEKSNFQSIATYFKDSLSAQPNAAIKMITLKYRSPNNYYIIHHFKNKQLLHFQPNINSNFYYISDNSIKWNISNDTKTILNIKCRKATTNLFGRNWIAWFSNEYPIPIGPYKFNNLPGLILQVHDSKNYYNFEAYHIKKEKELKIQFDIEKKYTLTTKEKFWDFEFKNKFDIDYMFRGLTFEDPKVMPTMRKNAMEKQKKFNNPLELVH